MDIKVSIVIGALREERGIESSLKVLHKYLDANKMINDTELVLVTADGGDKTIKIVEKYSGKFPNFQHLKPGKPVGKGRDINIGVKSAKGKVILYMDADLATPLHHIKDAVQLINNQTADLVIGIRNIRKMHNSKVRFLISLMGNLAFSLVSGRYVPDTQCGFKAFSYKASKICFSRQTMNDWSFDMELLIIAFSHNLSIAQLPITDWRDVPGGTFSGGIKNSVKFGIDLLKIFHNRLTGKYKKDYHEFC